MLNKCYLSTISVQYASKKAVKEYILNKKKFIGSASLFKKKKTQKQYYLFSNTEIIKNTT